jgi:GntR family transcriptional regulator, transcriptional repressor for pyruvate dehydrogenase complex
MLNQINKDVLSNKIVELLIKRIKEKHFKPGDKLPGERDLANTLGVGRSSLREALRILDHMNVLEIRPGLGTFVTSLEIESLIEPIEFTFAMDNTSVLKVFETRKTLELKTVELAAEYITPEETLKLDQLFTKMTDDTQSFEYRESVDREFHALIASASRNPMLYRFVCVVLEALTKKRQESYMLPNASQTANLEHERILKHLKAHQPEEARQAMLDHLNTTENNLLQLISNQKEL